MAGYSAKRCRAAMSMICILSLGCEYSDEPEEVCEGDCVPAGICGLHEYRMSGTGSYACMSTEPASVAIVVNESSFFYSGSALSSSVGVSTVVVQTQAAASMWNGLLANAELVVDSNASLATRDVPSFVDPTDGCGTTDGVSSVSLFDGRADPRAGYGILALTGNMACDSSEGCLHTESDIELYAYSSDYYGIKQWHQWTFEESALECDSTTMICEINVGVVIQHELGHVLGLGDQPSEIYQGVSMMGPYDAEVFESISLLPWPECRAVWYLYGSVSSYSGGYPPPACNDPEYVCDK